MLHISGRIMQCLSSCDWLISLHIMSLKLIHNVAYGRISFFVKGKWYSIVSVYQFSLSSHLSMDIRVVAVSWLLWITLQETWECRHLWDPNFNSFVYISRSGIAGSHGSSSFSFVRNFYIVFHSLYCFTFPPTVMQVCFNDWVKMMCWKYCWNQNKCSNVI